MNFIIDRSKWRCGEHGKYALGKDSTSLLNEEGFMCYLGQIERQLGLRKKDIYKRGDPMNTKVLNILTQEELLCRISNSVLSNEAIEINDNESITNIERERRLKDLFKKHGHKLKFINKGIKDKSKNNLN